MGGTGRLVFYTNNLQITYCPAKLENCFSDIEARNMQTTYSVLNLLLSILALYDVNSRDILQLKCRIAIFINIRLPP